MPYEVLFHAEFGDEFAELSEPVREELLGMVEALKEFGPTYGTTTRKHVGTLRSKAYPNLKELRFNCDGVWRFAFAFDPQRNAIVLVGGDKEGENQRLFYTRLIGIAERRYAAHLKWLAETKEEKRK